jgi:hypothetical protein
LLSHLVKCKCTRESLEREFEGEVFEEKFLRDFIGRRGKIRETVEEKAPLSYLPVMNRNIIHRKDELFNEDRSRSQNILIASRAMVELNGNFLMRIYQNSTIPIIHDLSQVSPRFPSANHRGKLSIHLSNHSTIVQASSDSNLHSPTSKFFSQVPFKMHPRPKHFKSTLNFLFKIKISRY